MSNKETKVKALTAAVVAAVVCSTTASAQDAYPSKPIRMIVPYAAGANGDVVARLLTARLSPALGQQIVVDNRAGAGGNIGAEAAARSPADGYVLVLGTNTHAINMSLYAKPGFDLLKDFAPIALVSSAPLVLIVHPSLPVKSVRELITLAKASPGKLNYGTGGSGSSAHIAMELLKTQTGTDILHVPYKGVAQALTDLIGGRTQVMFNATSTAMDQIEAKRARGLAVSSSKRSALAPGLPTVAESGVPGYEAVLWQGVLAPAGTPASIVDRLNREIVKVLASPEVQKQFNSAGVDTMPSTPAQFQAYLKTDVAKWAKVVKASGAKVD